jgi:hypothetical protein
VKPDVGNSRATAIYAINLCGTKLHTVLRRVTGFYACSGCSVMMLNPEQFNAHGHAAPNIEMPRVVPLRSRR